MKKLFVGLLATLAVLSLVGCENQKIPAEQAVAAADAALVPIRDSALKYAPDQLQAIDAQLNGGKGVLAKGDYKGVLAAMPAINTSISGLKDTVAAKAQEAQAALQKAQEDWGTASKEVPKMVDAIESRVNTLSKSHHLPKGVTKESLAAAKSGVDAMKSAWSDASSAATAGDFTTAMNKAQAVKDQGMKIMESLGMKSS